MSNKMQHTCTVSLVVLVMSQASNYLAFLLGRLIYAEKSRDLIYIIVNKYNYIYNYSFTLHHLVMHFFRTAS